MVWLEVTQGSQIWVYEYVARRCRNRRKRRDHRTDALHAGHDLGQACYPDAIPYASLECSFLLKARVLRC